MESPNNALFGCQNKILGREPNNKKHRFRSCLLGTIRTQIRQQTNGMILVAKLAP